jgi:hypothetical protein
MQAHWRTRRRARRSFQAKHRDKDQDNEHPNDRCRGGPLTAALLTRSEAAPVRHPLPLHDGFYVEADVPCSEAYMAAMMQMMGDHFESGRELCTIKSVSQHGHSFIVTDECQETSMGGKTSGKLNVVVPDDHTVIFGAGGNSTRYRYCPIPSLPDGFKDAHEMVPDTPPFTAAR